VAYDALVRNSPDGGEVIPHIAKGWESNDDFTQWTVFLRPGMKWSDGEPFSADDILFWYENIVLNGDLSPSAPVWMQNGDGTVATVEKIDDTTVKWTFAQPNTAFLANLANMDGADRAISNLSFVPAHYLKQFHPDFVDQAELDAKVAERGFQTWTELFAVEAFPHMSGKRPSTAAWAPDGTTVADQVFTIKRNPYYFVVDQDGNQLPYMDEVRFTFFADSETLNLAAIGGEIDMQGRHIKMSNYPVLVENEDKGGYRVLTYPTFGGSDAVLMLNQTYVNDPAVGELLQNKDFRIALSHAIDREAIKELAFLGIGEARQPVPAPNHPFYPGDEVAFKYTQHDLDKANALLEGIGLTERDGEGMRLVKSKSCPSSENTSGSGSPCANAANAKSGGWPICSATPLPNSSAKKSAPSSSAISNPANGCISPMPKCSRSRILSRNQASRGNGKRNNLSVQTFVVLHSSK
jgi:peptide/nickel transport system substrate-binding protein